MLASPVISRLFTPEQFGLLALFTTTSMFVGNIATMQYDSAIMLPEKDDDALNLMALAFISVVFFCLLTIVGVVFFNDFLVSLTGDEEIKNWLYLVPISVFLTGFFRILNIWAGRQKKFKRVATRNILQTSITAGTKIGIGILSFIDGGLIIGSLIGQFIATLVFALQTFFTDKLIVSGLVNRKKMIFLAKKYKDFPLFINLQGFLDMFKETGIRYTFSNFYGSSALGAYSFTLGLLQKPGGIIGQAVSNVYFQKATEVYNSGRDLWSLTKRIMIRLLLLSLIIYLPLLFWGPQIFKFVFSDKWEMAGKYAQIMTPWLIVHFMMQFSTRIPQIVDKQKTGFFISLFNNLLLLSLVLVFAKLKFDFEYVLASMSFFMVSMLIFMFFWFREITKKHNNLKKR
jgi:O-antigen/teichoic acid export membrane protein